MQISESRDVTVAELVDLYGSVGWNAYTREPRRLAEAIANSSIVVLARDDRGVLIGLARGLSDDASVFYLQDLLVRPDHQRTGIGTQLLASCLERYRHVRQKVLLADDEEAQRRFYERSGYRHATELEGAALNAFVRLDG